MEEEEVSPLEREHSLSVVLPGGLEKNATVHGSKPVMDLLVTLCASYHLNPSDYTVEVLSTNKNNVTFKPNSPIGLLEAEKIVLKPKVGEEKVRTPYMPEATVRLLINYNKSHKAVVRVNPRVPLETLLPTVCNKCEFQLETTILLRDSEAKEELDLSKTLNEYGLREVYAQDTGATEHSGFQHLAASINSAKVSSSSSLQDLTKKEKKKSENKGFFSLFRKHRKKSEPTHALSAPSSPGPTKTRSASVSTQDMALCSSPVGDVPKKRRAPQPPMGAFHSFPNNLSSCHLPGSPSGENTLRSTKRKAPPPPPVANHPQESNEDTAKDCLNPLEEEKESVEHEASSPSPSTLLPSSSPAPLPLHKGSDPQPPNIRGKDLSDARAALAKVLTTSLSSGALIKRLKNTTAFPKNGSSGQSSENSVEITSVLNSNLPTENDFEDLQYKTGMTTFKVVPSRRQSDAEPAQDVPASDRTEAETETSEQVIPEVDPSINGINSPDQSENSSMPCPDEGDTTSCSLQPDNQSEDTVQTTQADEERLSENLEEKIISDHSCESAANEGDLRVTEEDSNGEDVKSVLLSNPESRNKFEDPLKKTGLTTFKVIPSRRESDPEQIQNILLKENDTETGTAEGVNPDFEPSLTGEDSLVQSEPKPDIDPSLTGEDSPAQPEPILDIDPTLTGEDSPAQSEPKPCPDEEETASCPVPLDNQSENSTDAAKIDEERIIEHLIEEMKPDQSHECVTNEGDLYLVDEEVNNKYETETCDDKAEEVAQDDSDAFPPPPPPVYFTEDSEEANGSPSVSAATRAVTNGHTRSNSEPPQAQRPSPGEADRTASGPSRFAQAVALAVQRSRLHSTGKTISALLHQET